ncbi:hypothetical protein [Acidithiobacillus sp.]|uniref:plasmid pRiA4b ORF-3 family protein n=1 Tax=Acidithiobacillus sp. TaxID=1872118 RepID=UPI0025C30D7C|nr:hypothetical protein [Acidithiobacillus sp.]MCK9189805.1 plasmid pRiA4b ORF-3 family protein [Acidithiobacillus sp.]MCK9360117.1 plasmid pRiA4b ORF-3 family protein [Acidithiobacillus sp.]
MATPRGPKTSPHHAYLLQVTLEGIDPPIWRLVWVESDMSLHALHHILQAAMGWTGAHLHEFTIDGSARGIAIQRLHIHTIRPLAVGPLFMPYGH